MVLRRGGSVSLTSLVAAFNSDMACGPLTMGVNSVAMVAVAAERWSIDVVPLAMGADVVAVAAAEVERSCGA